MEGEYSGMNFPNSRSVFERISGVISLRVADLGSLCIPVMAVSVLISIITRTMGVTIAGFSAEEISGYALLGTVLLVSGYAMRRGRHIRITAFVSFMPQWAQSTSSCVSYFLVLIYSSIIIMTGIKHAAEAFQLQTSAFAPSGVLLWPIMTFIPIGGLILFLETGE